MNEVLAIIKNRLEELKQQESDLRRETMTLQNRTNSNAEHLANVAKLVSQFEEAIKKLEN